MRFAVLILLLVPLAAQAYPAGSYVGEIAPGVTLVLRELLPPSECPPEAVGDVVLGGFIFDDRDASFVVAPLTIIYDEWRIPVREVYVIEYPTGALDALGLRLPRERLVRSTKSGAIVAFFVCPGGSLPPPRWWTTWSYKKPNDVVLEGGEDDAPDSVDSDTVAAPAAGERGPGQR